MSQKDIEIQHKWRFGYSADTNEPISEYSNSFDSELLPGVRFEIFCCVSYKNTVIVVLSKMPWTSATATIKIQMVNTNKSEQRHINHWINNCTLKCNNGRDRSSNYSLSQLVGYEFQCDITWHGFENLKPPELTGLHYYLKNFLTVPDLSDMMIVIDEEEIPVHKIILAAYSPVFLAMFKADMTESVNKRIVVTDIEVETMKKVIEFMYTSVIDPVPEFDVLLSILEVADKYEIMILKELCEEKLSEKITLKNVLEIFERASLYGVPQLMERTISFMVSNKLKIIELEDFADLHRRKPELLLEFFIRSITAH